MSDEVLSPKSSLTLSNARKVLSIEILKGKHFLHWGVYEKAPKKPAYLQGGKFNSQEWNQREDVLVSFARAKRVAQKYNVKVGLCVPDGMVVIDFDNCRDPDSRAINPPVKQLIDKLQTTVWISASGTGLHVPLYARREFLDGLGSKITNPSLSPGSKRSEIKHPKTFVAMTFESLNEYQEIKAAPDWLRNELFPAVDRAHNSLPSAGRDPDDEISVEEDLRTSASKIRERFFKGYTNGGYIWRLLLFNAKNTAPFIQNPQMLHDRSQWIILVIRAYFQDVLIASNSEAMRLVECYDQHWLRHFPNQTIKRVPHNKDWYQQTVLKQRDEAQLHALSTNRSAFPSFNQIVRDAIMSSRQLPRKEREIVMAVIRRAIQTGDLSVQLSDQQLASEALMHRSALAAPKRSLKQRRLPWFEVVDSVPTTYRLKKNPLTTVTLSP